jgi:hypothetical protein
MHERVIGPYVPEDATKRPAGAAVSAEGMVICVTCQQQIPLVKADVVGLGYRCTTCSQKAELAKLMGAGDAGSHFTASERRGLANSGLILALCGIPVLLLGALAFWFVSIKGGVILFGIGAGMMSVGFARRGAAQ